MELDVSIAIITFFEPDVADTYHGRIRGSKSFTHTPSILFCLLPGYAWKNPKLVATNCRLIEVPKVYLIFLKILSILVDAHTNNF
jgi:hypothetical protein